MKMLMRYGIWHLGLLLVTILSILLVYTFLLEPITKPLTLQEPNPSEAEIGNEMDASDVAGINTQLSSSNNIVPSSFLMTEDDNIVVSSDNGPQCSMQVLKESKDCQTEEGSCKDATEVSHFTAPILCLLP